MNFREYDEFVDSLTYENTRGDLIYPTLGLVGESGEVAEKIKKVLVNDKGVLTDERREYLLKELGDVLWYLSRLSQTLGSSLESVANGNIEKLKSRKERGVSMGDGDNR